MPFPVGAAIAAGGSLLGQGINAIAQGSMNKQTRRYNTWMYDRSREHALQDWNLQNSYDHPSAQMARLRDAGLNPLLMYGNGQAATGNSSDVRQSSTGSWNPKAPEIDPGSIIGAYQNAEIREAQLDNLRAQNDLLLQDKAMKAAQIYSILAGVEKTRQDIKTSVFDLGVKMDTRDVSIDNLYQALRNARLSGDHSEFDLKQKGTLAPYQLEALKAGIQKTYADTKNVNVQTRYTLDKNERETAMTASNLREAAARIITMQYGNDLSEAQYSKMQHEIGILMRDKAIKDFEIQLNRSGMSKGDALWMRSLSAILENIRQKLNVGKGQKSLQDVYNGLKK